MGKVRSPTWTLGSSKGEQHPPLVAWFLQHSKSGSRRSLLRPDAEILPSRPKTTTVDLTMQAALGDSSGNICHAAPIVAHVCRVLHELGAAGHADAALEFQSSGWLASASESINRSENIAHIALGRPLPLNFFLFTTPGAAFKPTMTLGAVLEPLVVVTLLFGGAWFNRNRDYSLRESRSTWAPVDGSFKKSDEFRKRDLSQESLVPCSESSWGLSVSPSSYDPFTQRRRRIKILGYERLATSPNTLVFKDRFLSRVLRKFPFLLEVWYWALIYWLYQIGRAFTALTLVEDTVDVARRHALEVIRLEQRLHIFYEVPIQKFFLQYPTVMNWINRVYSFIHIPGTILFLIVLYFLTTNPKRLAVTDGVQVKSAKVNSASAAGLALYEARRRTMAVCNLIAFVVFTLWPCMPPRLLSNPEYDGESAMEAKSFGFVDTVHTADGASSVWTTNKFCNQYAAMPSLHFGYSFLIGLTIATFPLSDARAAYRKRITMVVLGMSYPMLILTAIVATANHFILDAVAGAIVCGVAWHANGMLLNLCALEDHFLWMMRIHKPTGSTESETAIDSEQFMWDF
ncbi:hypothetical protein E4U53_005301 [Claviceps sorghi]|nr:hypothetical protein E4U53_005301 [Claviceps sorghi]